MKKENEGKTFCKINYIPKDRYRRIREIFICSLYLSISLVIKEDFKILKTVIAILLASESPLKTKIWKTTI